MAERPETQPLTHSDWVVVRDFTEDDAGYTLPRYEAKLLAEGRREYSEDELVLIRVTQPDSRREKRYRIPRSVLEAVTGRLP